MRGGDIGLDLNHIVISVSVLSCLHDVSLTNDWILHTFAWIHHWKV